MDRRRFLTASMTAGVTLAAGCTGGGGGEDGGDGQVVETTDVTMVNTQFDPRNIRVSAGATVTWTNQDGAPHTVTNASDNWSFDREVGADGSAQFTFEESDVYDAYCRFHGAADLSGMSMKIAVGDATIESPLGSSQQGGGGY